MSKGVKLETSLFDFIESDFSEYITIPKRKRKKEEDLTPIDNIILYYKNHCLTTILFNKEIEYKENIIHLKLDILNYDWRHAHV